MNIYTKIIAYITCLLLVVHYSWESASQNNLERHPYHILEQDGKIEIRGYNTTTVATTEVNDTDNLLEKIKSLIILLDYIYGNNSTNSEINLALPLYVQKKSNNSTLLSLYMPSHDIDTHVPVPKYDEIKIDTFTSKKVIAIKFTGLDSSSNFKDNLRELKEYTEQHNIRISDNEIIYAFYDPPWILPWFRKYEIIMEIQ